ncbi:WD40 repeat-containing protein [Xenococcus sp. PCC 7305]|uniref:WD40 domain-containing protein n=1 Tax=Xenococcus sp. PCC 7305 TaxID=102125 RepID=UPI0002AC541E|nr:CHAT domain-containing protein [Xenococcus sp. PCC 7305]ELS04467.1 WD40 repeat-containing protein [Xenococcus sp. PCC 7305]
MKTKILVLASNPSKTEQLKLSPEIRSIRESHERSQKRDKFAIVIEPAVRISDLQRIILSEKPRIVHFCGHGSSHKGLILENEEGAAQAISTEALTDLLKILKNRIECVVLNACHSQAQGKQIYQHINYLIATKKEIHDDAALLFTKGFYDALFNDMTYKEAYEVGCNRIHLELYKSDNVERKLVPAYSKEERDYINLEQHEILLFLENKFPNKIEDDILKSQSINEQIVGSLKSPQEKCQAKDLAEQMRGWFEALNYSFEEYEVWDENYFEWIITVPARRGYDRILIRGVEGEASIKDFQELSDLVSEHRTDEGWLVALRRVSAIAKQQSELKNIFCYTFDELLDDVAQFDGYIQWLTAEIQRRKIDTQYVPLACTKDEFDPETKQKLGTSKYDEHNGWIEGYIGQWLADDSKEHLSVLGEFGTGKTWFAFHYAGIALQKYLEAKDQGIERPRLPLVIPLRDYAKAVNMESLFSEFFFRKHEIPLPGYSAFEQLNRMGKLLLIFDGFDEMAARIDTQAMINNFWQLARAIVPGAKAILTCRTEHFPEAQQGRRLLSAELQASVAALTGEPPQFEVLELEKFNQQQIQEVLEKQEVQAKTIAKVIANQDLLDLARRPVMLGLIVEALPDIEQGKPIDISRIYLYAVTRKMNRDIKTKRTFTSLADKLYFLCELSWEMISKDTMSINYREFPERIRRCFGDKVAEAKELDHWHFDMMGQTILVRNSEGDYSPAHRSFLEFFVAYKFAAELGILAEDFAAIAEISEFQERLDLAETFGKQPLAKAVQELILPMISQVEVTKQRLLEVIQETKGKSEEQAAYLGGNGINLLLPLQNNLLTNQNLSGTVIKGGNFSQAHFRDLNLSAANLKDCLFAKQDFGTVFSVSWHPQESILATSHSDRTVRVWEVVTGRELLTLKCHNDWVRSVAWNPDGQALASASYDSTIKIWNPINGQCLQNLNGHYGTAVSVAWSPDGQLLASGSSDKTIKIWNPINGQCFQTLTGHDILVRSIAWSPNGQLLASASDDQTIKIWNPINGQCIQTLNGHTSWVASVVWRPDGQALASASYDSTIKIWNPINSQCLNTLIGHDSAVTSIVWSPNGQALASTSSDKAIKIWNPINGHCRKTLIGHNSTIRSASWNLDGQLLASASDDQTIKIWNPINGQCIQTLTGHDGATRAVAWSPNNQFLASASYGFAIKIWNPINGQCLQTLTGHANWVASVIWSPDGQAFASTSYDQMIKIWNPINGECLQTLIGHNSAVTSVAWRNDGQVIASGSSDKTIKIWNPINGKYLNTFTGHQREVRSVDWSNDGQALASGSSDETIKIWNPINGKCLNTLCGHQRAVRSVVWRPDGQALASGSYDQTIKIWNPINGQCFNTLFGHTNWVTSIVWSPDGQALASASYDQTIKIWNPINGQCLNTLCGHNSAVRSVAWTDNGQYLASGSYDSTIKIWDPNTGKCLTTWDNRNLCRNQY